MFLIIIIILILELQSIVVYLAEWNSNHKSVNIMPQAAVGAWAVINIFFLLSFYYFNVHIYTCKLETNNLSPTSSLCIQKSCIPWLGYTHHHRKKKVLLCH